MGACILALIRDCRTHARRDQYAETMLQCHRWVLQVIITRSCDEVEGRVRGEARGSEGSWKKQSNYVTRLGAVKGESNGRGESCQRRGRRGGEDGWL